MDILNGNILTPSRAKRNLNESFDYTSDYTPKSQSDTPILNYSIVENTLEDESFKPSIKLKLKVSEKQFQPQVILERFNQSLRSQYVHDDQKVEKQTPNSEDEIVDVDSCEEEYTARLRRKSTAVPTDTNVRRSSRCSSRVSYNEYMSPRKTRLRSCDSDEILATTPKKKSNNGLSNLKEISTPTTRSIRQNSTNHATPKVKKEIKNKANVIDIDDIPKQIALLKHAEEFTSPSKLGFENIAISSPAVKTTTPRKRARKQNLNENIMYSTPSKRDRTVSFQHEVDENVVNRRATRRSTRLNSAQMYSELETILAPIVNIKFNNIEEDEPKTPRKSVSKVKEPKTPKTPKTPASRMQMIRNGEITPSMHNRQTAIVKASTPLNLAMEKLHVSYVPKALPCREREYADILAFVEGKLLDGCGGCMYISGVPGTGKTATVTEVIRQLETMMKKKKVPKFNYVSINGMRLTEPRQSYVEILKQLTGGKTVAWEQAQSMLDTRFTKAKNGKKDEPIVLLVDELDILCTKRQDVVYNLLDWPTKATAQLIVITIANTMDLPERLLMGRVTSRLGLTRLTFQAYTHKQLQEIVMKRLTGTNAFNPDAVQLVARKVASVSGDARRALDICRRAAEIAELEGPCTMVAMQHVNDALNAMITQPKVRAIKRCSRLEQLLMQSVAAEVERTGVDETTFADVYAIFATVAGIDGFGMVSVTLALAAISRLGACRLLLTDQKSNDLHQRLILNVSADDIYYALRKD